MTLHSCCCGAPHPAVNGGRFDGIQHIDDAEPDEPARIALYTCNGCGSTRGLAAADDANADDFR